MSNTGADIFPSGPQPCKVLPAPVGWVLEPPTKKEILMREMTIAQKQAMLSKVQAAERLGYVAIDWAKKMAEAIRQQPRCDHPEVLTGTLRQHGCLDAAVHLLDRLSAQSCDCKERCERENADDPDYFFADWEHDCLPYRARELLQELSPAPGDRRKR